MARRRTRKDKIIAQLRREVQSKQKDTSVQANIKSSDKFIIGSSKGKSYSSEKVSSAGLFLYDQSLIKKDLLKTSILVACIFLVEIGFYIYFKI